MGRSILRNEPTLFDRCFALDDITISRANGGRTVEAYAAVFSKPYEVRDQHGHYMERIEPYAFDDVLRAGSKSVQCLYNHGMTAHGTPDMIGSVPIGMPLEIRADGKGLLTVTRYNESELADAVLASIKNGEIRSQSFRGRIVRSSPNGKVPRQRPGHPLPTVVRHQLGLTDFGPTAVPVNPAAEILAVRSVTDLAHELEDLGADERLELLRTLGVDLDGADAEDGDLEDLVEVDAAAASAGQEDDTSAATTAADADELRSNSGRLTELRRELLVRALELRGVGRGKAA